ncbi:MAG: hypothetical protein B7Z29_02195 [Hyphomicrobium sp. 12-62-95]|nr:MAG: hypothetical protein B7Z29_02195 [Hyphomicrobium sp. 12-62-95]
MKRPDGAYRDVRPLLCGKGVTAMPDLNPAQRKTRIILLMLALLLPTLSLIPLGGLYLYEHGFLLPWAVAALVVAAAGFLIERRWMTSGERRLAKMEAADERRRRDGHLTLSDRAWADVRTIAAKVDPETLTSSEAVLALGQRTIDAVARRMHPEKSDAVWQFTLPEALVIAERVSSRLGRFVETQIPLGDRLTVAQLMAVYRWRGMVGVAERAYDIWRVIRLANPATAVTHEAREQLSRAVVNWSKERVGRRIAEAYVEEVGRAAIDLYGGILRPHAEAEAAGAAEAQDGVRPGRAVRAVVIGASPSRLDTMTALAAAADRETELEGKPRILIEVSDAVDDDAVGRRQFVRSVSDSDIVVWCVDHQRGVTPGDVAAIDILKRTIAAGKLASPPGIVIAAVQPVGGALTDPEAHTEPLSAPLETFGRMPVVTLLLAADSPQRDLDIAALVRAVREQAERAPAFAARHRASRGVGSTARQAVTAAGTLAGQIFGRRN